jgi:predicted ATPase
MSIINYNKYPKGSEWRKWDLHLHTPYTNLNRYKASDEDFINKLKENNISVVAITNYYNFNDSEFELKDKLVAENIATFFNLELRSSYTNTDDKCCDIHVLFSEDVSKEDITKLLVKLNLNVGGSKIMACDIKPDEIEKATVDFDHLYNTLNEEALNLKGRHLIGFLSRGHGNSRSSSNFETISAKSNFLLHSTDKTSNIEKDRAFWLEQGKPLFQSSDAHSLNDIGLKYSWIKADPTFEGLKQVTYEPEERIRLQENKPDEKPDYQVIDSILLNKAGLWEDRIELNENLNTIIGGRATGKSSLLASIAEKLGKLESDGSDYKNYISSNTTSISLNWKDGQQKDDRDIDYFPQSHMFELARNDNKRNKLIKDIVSKKDKLGLFSQYEILIANKRSDLAALLSATFLTREELDKLNKSISELGDRESIETEKKKLEEKINKANSGLTESERQDYESVCAKIAKNTQDLKSCDNYTEELSTLKKCDIFYPLDIANYISQNTFKNELTTEFDQLKAQFEKSWLSAIDNKLTRVIDKKTEIQLLKDGSTEKEIYKKGQKQLEDNQAVIEIKKRLEIEISKLDVFDKKNGELLKKQEELKLKIEAICSIHQEFKNEAHKLSSNLKFKESDLQVTMVSVFDKTRVESVLSEQLLQRSNEQKSVIINFSDQYAEKPEETVKVFLELAISGQLQCKGSHTPQSVATQVLGSNTYTQSYELAYQEDNFHQMSQGKQAFVILKLLLEFSEKTCPILIDQPEDSLDNRAIYNELVKYLKDKKRDRQIILVTHNSNVVVSADAEQIIVANQNGITLPNSDGTKFQYVTGSIEHSKTKDTSENTVLLSQGIREHICEILEGGNEAFKKREQKYQLTKTI